MFNISARFRNLSLARKLTALGMAAAAAALLAGGAISLAFSLVTEPRDERREMATIAQVTSINRANTLKVAVGLAALSGHNGFRPFGCCRMC